MSFQDIFYLLGTIFAIFGISAFIMITVVSYLIYKKFKDLEQNLSRKSAIASSVLHQIPSFLSKKGYLALLPLIPTFIKWVAKKMK